MTKSAAGHAGVTRSSAFLPIALVLANLSALAISVAVPLLVSADQYSIFALCWSVGQLTASLAFEWMRIGVLRYAVGADTALAARRGATLWQGYALITATLLLGAVIAWAITPLLPYAGIIAVIAFYAACQGAFEGRQALARAHLHNGYYSAAWVLRTFISLLLALLAAWITGNGALALLGLAASYPVTLLLMNGLRRLPAVSRTLDGQQIGFLARYGFFAALASIASLFLASILRTIAISLLGLEQAGGVLLAVDLSQKAIMVVGLAVNIVMVQNTIRTAEFGSASQLAHQARSQLGISLALVAPATLGFYLLQGPFSALLVQSDYQVSYGAAIGWSCLASGILAFRMFAVDALFLALERPAYAVAGPAVSVILTVVTTPFFGMSAEEIAICFTFAAAVGAFVSLLLLARLNAISWPTRDVISTAAGCAAMLSASTIVPEGSDLVSLVAILTVCGAAYALPALALNGGGSRTAASALWRRLQKRRPMSLSQTLRRDLEVNSHYRGRAAFAKALLFSPSFGSVLLFRISQRLRRGGPIARFFSKILWIRNIHQYGCHLPPQAQIGEGLSLPHPVGVVVGQGCVVGKNVTLYQSVTLGRRNANTEEYPILGDGVVVYAGAVIVGAVNIGEGARIGANALVTTDVAPGSLVSVQPSKIIMRQDTRPVVA